VKAFVHGNAECLLAKRYSELQEKLLQTAHSFEPVYLWPK
jgi:hypothetical protein